MVPHRGKLIRPLLFVTRLEVEAYCAQHNISARVDATNTDQSYRRNKIRHLLIPLLAREFNPEIINTLSRTAIILQEEEELLVEAAQNTFNRLRINQDERSLALNRQGWLALERALQRRVLRQAAVMLGLKVNFEQVEEAREVIIHGGTLTWPRGVQLCARETEVFWQVPAASSKAKGFNHRLQVPGLTPIAEIGQAIRAELAVPPPSFQGGEDEAWLDWDKLEKPLLVRNWQPGDYFRPLGMAGKKKLQDFYTDIRLPPARRRLVPLVVSGKQIVWVAGLRLSDDFKITDLTRTALHLQLEAWPG
jgi:tRNA(Ile)-lysidine synthase